MAVYFVKSGKHFKIGYSDDVPRRLSQLRTGCAESLDLLAVIPGPMRLEKQLHELLRDYRAQGEWFRYNGKARAFVRVIIAGAHPNTPEDVDLLWHFATGDTALSAAKKTIADPSSTHEQLKDAHILVRDLTP
jgi:hypothetical protein